MIADLMTEIKKKKFGEFASQTELLYPSSEMTTKILNSSRLVWSFARDQNVEAIVTSGGSTIVTRMFLASTRPVDMENIPVYRLGRAPNQAVYKMGYPDEMDETLRLDVIRNAITTNCPKLTKNTSFVIVDEIIESGAKSFDYLARLKQLGYQSAKFATFVAPTSLDFSNQDFIEKSVGRLREISYFQQLYDEITKGNISTNYSNDVFIASRDPKLMSYLKKLSGFVSRIKNELYENDQLYEGSARTNLEKQAVLLLRTINGRLREKEAV